MTQAELEDLLRAYKSGNAEIAEVVRAFQRSPLEDLGFAKVDLHRGIRQHAAEVIYGQGKSSDQIEAIAKSMLAHGESRILITRLDPHAADALSPKFDKFRYDAHARVAIIGDMPAPDGNGKVVVATGGTTDIPVAEEAALTLEYLGNEVVRVFDIGIAGLHRVLKNLDTLCAAQVIVAVAGMEGALPSVLAGLVSCPVIAVPTSVGYGASFHGVTALLAMLNSCASGVSVVNIDNGFGAAFQASEINHLKARS
ncbi:MAG: nickel pincer cofactor biosynthesis protein LarB [Proteobacteria bacterium]|nr:nickel pincer cofactor biosynthesis protein LarB [Pseudomonadota bacterium]